MLHILDEQNREKKQISLKTRGVRYVVQVHVVNSCALRFVGTSATAFGARFKQLGRKKESLLSVCLTPSTLENPPSPSCL